VPLACPKCGSRDLRPARPQNDREKYSHYWFVAPLRCKDCRTRFVSRTIFPEDLLFARCPECDRMDLNGWTGKTFTPTGWTWLKCTFGANKWRCEYCRLNFASFRKRKEVFTFSRWKKRNPTAVAEAVAPTAVGPPADGGIFVNAFDGRKPADHPVVKFKLGTPGEKPATEAVPHPIVIRREQQEGNSADLPEPAQTADPVVDAGSKPAPSENTPVVPSA